MLSKLITSMYEVWVIDRGDVESIGLNRNMSATSSWRLIAESARNERGRKGRFCNGLGKDETV